MFYDLGLRQEYRLPILPPKYLFFGFNRKIPMTDTSICCPPAGKSEKVTIMNTGIVFLFGINKSSALDFKTHYLGSF